MEKLKKIFFSLFLIMSYQLLGEDSTGSVTQILNNKLSENEKGIEISSGERLQMPDKGFSIVPPNGWEVYRNYPNTTLLFQIPYQRGIGYQRTIQLLARTSPLYIDAFTGNEIIPKIVGLYSKISSSIKNYKVRNDLIVDLPSGMKALMFYTEFQIEDKNLMQLHVVVSSEKRHYILSYTDLAEHFEEGKDKTFLNEAWECLTSIELDSKVPNRFGIPLNVIYILSGLLLLSILFALFRKKRSSTEYRMALANPEESLSRVDADTSSLRDHIYTKFEDNKEEDSWADFDDDAGNSKPLEKKDTGFKA